MQAERLPLGWVSANWLPVGPLSPYPHHPLLPCHGRRWRAGWHVGPEYWLHMTLGVFLTLLLPTSPGGYELLLAIAVLMGCIGGTFRELSAWGYFLCLVTLNPHQGREVGLLSPFNGWPTEDQEGLQGPKSTQPHGWHSGYDLSPAVAQRFAL